MDRVASGRDLNSQRGIETFILDRAVAEGLRIFAIGFGNPTGEIIPIRDENGQVTGYKKDKKGEKGQPHPAVKILKTNAPPRAGKLQFEPAFGMIKSKRPGAPPFGANAGIFV